jgi:TolA-binding protein
MPHLTVAGRPARRPDPGITMKQAASFLVALSLALVLASPAFAQIESREAIALQNQILELRRQLDQLRGGVPAPVPVAPAAPRASGGGSADLTAQLLDRVAALDEQVRSLRGQVEAQGHALDVGTADLGKKIGDLDFRLQTLEGGHPAAAATPAAPAALAHKTPEALVQQAAAALARHDYPAAETAGREAKALKGPRSIDGQFLLAQALAGQRKWPEAAVEFNDTYERARTGAHAPDSLLGLANALAALKDNRSACDALAKLRVEFPAPRADLKEPIAAARARAGCR